MGTGAWITGGGVLFASLLVYLIIRGFRAATKAQAQAERDRSAIEHAEERNKAEDKAELRGAAWVRQQLRDKWMRRT